MHIYVQINFKLNYAFFIMLYNYKIPYFWCEIAIDLKNVYYKRELLFEYKLHLFEILVQHFSYILPCFTEVL